MITNFASFPGFTALNCNVDRPSKLKLENALTQAVNRPIEPVMFHGKLLLNPKLESVSKQAPNAAIEQINSFSNHRISRKCPDSKKKSYHVAPVVFKIPNKEHGYRRKKFYSSFLCSNRTESNRHFKSLNESTVALTLSQTIFASSYRENKMNAGVKKVSFANAVNIPSNVPVAQYAVDKNTLKCRVVSAKNNKHKVVESKPPAKFLPPATSTRAIAANYDLSNRHLPTNESIEPSKSSLRHKIPQKSSVPKKKLEQFAPMIIKVSNKEQGYRQKKIFSSSLCSHRARRKRRFEMLSRSSYRNFEWNQGRHHNPVRNRYSQHLREKESKRQEMKIMSNRQKQLCNDPNIHCQKILCRLKLKCNNFPTALRS